MEPKSLLPYLQEPLANSVQSTLSHVIYIVFVLILSCDEIGQFYVLNQREGRRVCFQKLRKAKLYCVDSHTNSDDGLLVTHFVRNSWFSFMSSQIAQGERLPFNIDVLRLSPKIPALNYTIERHNAVAGTPASYSGSPRFVPRPAYRISWLICS